ncbi:hypothetical protein ABZV34_37845, partial [Streptomyces sp. NPDC005195]
MLAAAHDAEGNRCLAAETDERGRRPVDRNGHRRLQVRDLARDVVRVRAGGSVPRSGLAGRTRASWSCSTSASPRKDSIDSRS